MQVEGRSRGGVEALGFLLFVLRECVEASHLTCLSLSLLSLPPSLHLPFSLLPGVEWTA